MTNHDYINEQWGKKLKAAEKQKAHLQVKESTPEYRNKQIDKKHLKLKRSKKKRIKNPLKNV